MVIGEMEEWKLTILAPSLHGSGEIHRNGASTALVHESGAMVTFVHQ